MTLRDQDDADRLKELLMERPRSPWPRRVVLLLIAAGIGYWFYSTPDPGAALGRAKAHAAAYLKTTLNTPVMPRTVPAAPPAEEEEPLIPEKKPK